MDTVRKTPCASCPYRRDVPSGVWAESEYDKLPDYDGEISEQAGTANGLRAFSCHQGDGKICAGWAGHRDPHDLIALKLDVSRGKIDPAAMSYKTTVPLFASGAEAAEHGKRDISQPSQEALKTVTKVTTVRSKRGEPVRYS
jgi:hypothetical protein